MSEEEKSHPSWNKVNVTFASEIQDHTLFFLRIPNKMLEQLEKIADKHNKVITEEISYLIENHIEKAKVRKL